MIKWRDGKAGFVGASKRLIKGFFSYSYSVTTAAVEAPSAPGERTIVVQPHNRTWVTF